MEVPVQLGVIASNSHEHLQLKDTSVQSLHFSQVESLRHRENQRLPKGYAARTRIKFHPVV